jgi:cytosine/adenosine deaminase-related metal-dependent hydrolase/ubiquinone/menaquinone biosynthesis C-methylase UbiE
VGAQLYQFAQTKAGEPVSAVAEFPNSMQNAGVFAAWAEVYDKQPNPLLALEERYLSRLLPNLHGKDVLDIGCGTGRWLRRLVAGHPASLHGLDSSPEMLRIAARRQLENAQFTQAELPVLPMATDSADLALCSFVFSYVDNIALCASELARVVRDEGDLFLSDMHPETAAGLGWKRGFGNIHPLQVHQRSLEELLSIFLANGFELVACIEPQFGDIEHEMFRISGKRREWDQACGLPAIYLLQFRRVRQRKAASNDFCFNNANCALGPNEMAALSVSIEGNTISSVVSRAALSHSDQVVDLSGYLLFPGFINTHDHLEFALFPRLGSPPYRNATQWATDIQANESATIALHKQVPKDTRLWWGGVRNLLCGATTVCHHNPLDPVLRDKDFPVRVVTQYGWAHSPAFAANISGALQSTGADEPFLIHACEGMDKEAFAELYALDALHALEHRSVLIHGLALDEAGIALLNKRDASLVVCPSSNQFLFGKTHMRDQLLSVKRLALGSDSPLTAKGDLLDELRFAKSVCGMHANELYALITGSAANILRLRHGEGALRPGSIANLVAVRHRAGTSAEILSELSWRDVEFVMIGGRIQLASAAIMDRLPVKSQYGLSPLLVEDELRWLSGPVDTMLKAAERVLGKRNVRLGRLKISAAEA